MDRFSDYEAAAINTAVYPGQGIALGLIYCALKGAGEAGEFADHVYRGTRQHLSKEIGDELWYCAAKARELGFTLAGLLGTDNIVQFGQRYQRNGLNWVALHGASAAGEFAEQVGKAIRDDGFGTTTNVLTDARRDALTQSIQVHMANLARKADQLGTSLAEIAAENIAKLASRKARGTLGGSGDNR